MQVSSLSAKTNVDFEERRLAALDSYDILDTSPEPDFDDIARLASDLCETPIAVINLIADRRQFFKAEVGLGVRETPYESSFCVKAILEQDFLMVPDATKDSRFDCNPLVTSAPHLRFYAGALLKTEDGLPIGTICVLDFRPRDLSKLQQRTLRVLAKQVMAQLELRRALKAQVHETIQERRLRMNRDLHARKLEAENERFRLGDERLRTAQDVGGIGIFEIDVAMGRMEVSDEFCHIFGLPVRPVYSTSQLESLVVEADATISSNDLDRAVGSAKLDVEYRIRRADDGVLCWIARRARFIEDASGTVVKMVGIVTDITQAKRKDARTTCLLSLGDRLRVTGTVQEASQIAAEVLAEGLFAQSTGYATIDRQANEFVVAFNRTADGAKSIAGRYPLASFAKTIEKLSDGEILALSDTADAAWLDDDRMGYNRIGVRSFIKVPMLEHGSLVGVLFAHETEPRSWIKEEMEFAWGVADRTYAALAKIEAEAEQRLLNHELSHRLKNTLAMVQAIAGQTLKGVTEREAVHAFTSRLQALSSAHEVLLHQNFTSSRIRTVIDKVIALHSPEGRIDIAGSDLAIGPKAAMSLSLILHELATNAVKHGALSNERGRVAISWKVEDPETDSVLTLEWAESGGPPVIEPQSKGFGSRLIGTGICGVGGVARRYEPSGFTAIFRAPLSIVLER